MKWPAFLQAVGKATVDWWDAWVDLAVITIVWLLAQVTVVLSGPATFGAHYVVNSLVRGENPGVRGMFAGARQYFWKAILWQVINWAVIGLALLNIWFYGSIEAWYGPVLQAFIIGLTILWMLTQFYAVPFWFELVEPKLFVAWRSGLFMLLATPFYTFGIILVVVVVAVLCVGLVIPTFLGGPLLIMMIATRAVFDRLEAFGVKKKEVDPRMEEGGEITPPGKK